MLHLFLLLPQFLSSIFSEHNYLKKLQEQRNFDVIISDNRYGLWHKQRSGASSLLTRLWLKHL